MVQRSCLPLRKGSNPVVAAQRYAAAEDLEEKPFNAGFESVHVHAHAHRGVFFFFFFIFILVHKYESADMVSPLSPLPVPSRGHLSLQSMRNLVSEREEPARPSDVLLQRAAEGAGDGGGGERRRPPPDPQHLPLPTVQQELLWSQSFGDALEHITQW